MITREEIAFRAARHAALSAGYPPYPGVREFDASLCAAKSVLAAGAAKIPRLWWALLDRIGEERAGVTDWLSEAVLSLGLTVEGLVATDGWHKIYLSDPPLCQPAVPKPETGPGVWAAYVHFRLPRAVYMAELRYRAAREAARQRGILPYLGIPDFDAELAAERSIEDLFWLAGADYLRWPTYHPGEPGGVLDTMRWLDLVQAAIGR